MLALRLEVVAPHPRYPDWSSVISDRSSAYDVPAAANVGSLFGLKPYSAISLLRISSAFFLAFRFRQNQKPKNRSAAITTMGMTTAIAIVPLEPRPDEEPPFLSPADNADGVGEDDVEAVVSLAVADC